MKTIIIDLLQFVLVIKLLTCWKYFQNSLKISDFFIFESYNKLWKIKKKSEKIWEVMGEKTSDFKVTTGKKFIKTIE